MKTLILAALFLSGCATSIDYLARVQAWHGQQIGDYLQGTTPPDNTLTFISGRTAYVWTDGHNTLTIVADADNYILYSALNSSK